MSPGRRGRSALLIAKSHHLARDVGWHEHGTGIYAPFLGEFDCHCVAGQTMRRINVVR